MTKNQKLRLMCIALCLTVLLSGCMSTVSTEDMGDYLRADVSLGYDHVLFPDEEALSAATVNLYRSETKSTLLFDDIYFLLSCTYSSEAYTNEIERIVGCGAEYREDLFDNPAYVMLLSGDDYEYVLTGTEENTLVYVYAQTADWSIFDNFPAEYLPLTGSTANICQYAP